MRVRLKRIEGLDLSLFEFDLDLTMMIFFLDADSKMYARYGGRDGKDADNRQSLAGLRYTMHSVLAMHAADNKTFAPPPGEPSLASRSGRGCTHCHHVKERANKSLELASTWDRNAIYRFPLPDNVGLVLEVDRGNIVQSVKPGSPAAKAGLQPGDRVRRLNGVPVHSFGDAQYALDRGRKERTLPIAWTRGDTTSTAKLDLPTGWQKSDLHWRRSIQRWLPSLHMDGTDLTVAEKKALGLSPQQLAYRLRLDLHPHVKKSGIQDDDIILGYNGQLLQTNMNGFYEAVCTQHLVGDEVTIEVLREGRRAAVPMKLIR